MQDSNLMQREKNAPLSDVQSHSLSTKEQSTKSKANSDRIDGKHLDSEKENICPQLNSSAPETPVPEAVLEAIRSQKCIETQINMVSRCLKQSAEEAIQAFEDMFQNDILALEP